MTRNLLDADTQKSFIYLQEVEELAQNIITDKQNKLDLSNSRNKFQEALRAIETVNDRKSWIKIGLVYVELPSLECRTILKREIASATKDIDSLHEDVKEKLCKMRDLEHQPVFNGLKLKPMSHREMNAIYKNFGIR